MTNSPPAATKQTQRKRLTPQVLRTKARNFINYYIYTDIEEVILQKDLVDEEYKTKSNVQVREADHQKVMQFCSENPDLRDEKIRYLSYLDNHYHGALAELDGKIIGGVWWFDHRLDQVDIHPHLVRYKLNLKPGEVWSFDLFILSQDRGSGISNDFFKLFRKYLRNAEYTRLYGHVSSSNLPAVWLHKLQGYKPVKTVKSHLFCNALMLSEGRLFLRNPSIGVKQKFDYRPLF